MARGSGTENDVLVIGLGRFGAAAALELRRLGHKVTAIEKDGFLAEKFLGRISHVIHGDASDVAVIRDAKAVDPDKPFFLYFSLDAAHAPHHVFPERADKY